MRHRGPLASFTPPLPFAFPAAIAQRVQGVWPQISGGVQEFGVQFTTLLAQKAAARLIRFGMGLSDKVRRLLTKGAEGDGM
jgi:hypothetical protein